MGIKFNPITGLFDLVGSSSGSSTTFDEDLILTGYGLNNNLEVMLDEFGRVLVTEN